VQFKEQGSKVQVLLYIGFDEAKNAPIVKSVGSFDKYTYKPSPGLIDKLTPEQRDELEAEWQRRRRIALGLNRQHYINSLAANIRGACDSLDNGAALTPQQSAEIWDAMAELVRAMREAGYARPTRNRKTAQERNQGNLFE
jgi:hypothetical protein